jgi:hypothetical protein
MLNLQSKRDELKHVFEGVTGQPHAIRELAPDEVLNVAGAATTTEYAILSG